MALARTLLLIGPPGVGKTTIMRKVAQQLADLRLGGFLTEEIRRHGQRVGFRLETFAGRSGTLAHIGLPARQRVGKYGVYVAFLDEIAQTVLAPGRRLDVYLIDEIGRMECLSRRFVEAITALLEMPRPLVATVAARGPGMIDEVKRRPDVELWHVTRQNRDTLPAHVVSWVFQRRRPRTAVRG